MNYREAKELAEKLKISLEDSCERIEIVGSVKRADKDEVHDIEILCIPKFGAPAPIFGQSVLYKSWLEYTIGMMVKDHILGFPVLNGPKLKKFAIIEASKLNPFFLELYIVRPETWAIQNVIRTGPSDFSKRFVTNKAFGGLLPDQYTYIKGETRIETRGEAFMIKNVELREEKDAIALLGLGWIEPKARRAYV